jgi:hypothetical protein
MLTVEVLVQTIVVSDSILMGTPVKLNTRSGGKPNGIPG